MPRSFLFFFALVLPALPADLIVKITGFPTGQGFVGCALFSAASASAFPLDQARAKTQRHPARGSSVECRYSNLPPGEYALAASADLNDNGKTDKNFLGMPTEPWGVSRNARPKLRAPRFAEAAFTIDASQPTTFEIQLAK